MSLSRAEPRRARDAERLDERVRRDAQQGRAQEEQRHAQTGARTDAQHVGTGERIAEEGLHLQAAGGEGRAGEERRDGFEQADFEDDVAHGRVARTARKRCPDVAQGHCDRADQQVGREKRGGQQRQNGEKYGGAASGHFERGVCYSRRL